MLRWIWGHHWGSAAIILSSFRSKTTRSTLCKLGNENISWCRYVYTHPDTSYTQYVFVPKVGSAQMVKKYRVTVVDSPTKSLRAHFRRCKLGSGVTYETSSECTGAWMSRRSSTEYAQLTSGSSRKTGHVFPGHSVNSSGYYLQLICMHMGIRKTISYRLGFAVSAINCNIKQQNCELKKPCKHSVCKIPLVRLLLKQTYDGKPKMLP